jgi:hypothetical protein
MLFFVPLIAFGINRYTKWGIFSLHLSFPPVAIAVYFLILCLLAGVWIYPVWHDLGA